MLKQQIEDYQVWLYIPALICGIIVGLFLPHWGVSLTAALSPVMILLLYSMFSQIPFSQIGSPLRHKKFLWALLLANFIMVPIVVRILIWVFPQSPAVMIGVYLVLLTPCIDYVIVFTHLGKGNSKLMLMVTPLLLMIQLILLPLYLALFVGKEITDMMTIYPLLEAFGTFIIVPLLGATLVQLWSTRYRTGKHIIEFSSWLPVPMMAIVLFVVVASQWHYIQMDWHSVQHVIPIYILFMLIMPILSRCLAMVFALDTGEGRTLIFSASTRNSLVVLPMVFALPDSWIAIAAATIITQTIVELIGEMIYIRIVPYLWHEKIKRISK